MAQVQYVSYIDLDVADGAALADELAVQRAAAAAHLARCHGREVAELREIRLGGFEPARTELRKALDLCQRHGATLLVAKLERLARDPAFLADLRRDLLRRGLRFVAADMPEASEVTVGIMAALAAVEDAPAASAERLVRKRDYFARLIDRQSRDAAKRREARGRAGPLVPAVARTPHSRPSMRRTLERALSVAPVLAEIRAAGATTFEEVAHALNELGVPSARGDRWYPSQVRQVEKRIASVG